MWLNLTGETMVTANGTTLRRFAARGAVAVGMAIGAAVMPVTALRGQQAGDAAAVPETRPADAAPVAAGGRGGGGRGGFTAPAAGFGRGGGRGESGGGRIGAAPALGTGSTCSLDATIYDVRIPADQIGRLDVEALAKAAGSAEAFEKALAALGTVQPLYRANQSVRLGGDTIRISTQTPYTTNSQATARGQVVNSVSYRDIGAIFSIAGKAGAGGNMEMDLQVEVSTLTEGTTQLSETVKAPLFRTATLLHKGPVEAKQPFVLMSVDGATADPSGKAVAYIARVTLGAPRGE